jgi:hypothetical protein
MENTEENRKKGKIHNKSKSNSEKDREIMEETQVEYRKYLKKYGREACLIVK